MRHPAPGRSLLRPSEGGVTVAIGAGHCLRLTILEVLAPVNLRSNQTRLELQTRTNGTRFFELGYPHAMRAREKFLR